MPLMLGELLSERTELTDPPGLSGWLTAEGRDATRRLPGTGDALRLSD